jgi:hypothetical protein
MKFHKFLVRDEAHNYAFIPSMGMAPELLKIGIMKFRCESEEMKLFVGELQKKACNICPNKVEYVVGDCWASSCKLFGNGIFVCYHKPKETK